MADGGQLPEAIPPDIYYKCHPKQVNSTVICIICESVFHKCDFNKKENVHYVTKVLVICDEHRDLQLTTKKNNNDPRLILTALKQQIHNHNQEIITLKEKNKQLYTELNKLKTAKTENMDLDTTLHTNDAKLESLDNESIIIENNLLKELNTTLKDKNKLLEELLQKEKATPKISQHTYANVTAHTLNKNFTQTKNIPKIIVKRKNKDDKSPMKDKVLHYLIKDKTIQTKSINIKNNDEIIINCMTAESVKAAERYLESKLNKLYKVEKEQMKKPVIKIVGIENVTQMDISELENDINSRNFSKNEHKGKILHMSSSKDTNKTTAIMELTAELHKQVKENRDRLFVGYQNCKIYDVINAKPCYNCGRFGHNGSKCRNDPVCLICAEEHSTSACNKKNNICCTNCKYVNEKYGKKIKTDHMPYDSEKCEVLRNKINKEINSTEYNIKPSIQRYVGKAEIFSTKRKQATTLPMVSKQVHRWSSSLSLASSVNSPRSTD